MPWHCDVCRQLRHEQRKEKAAAETTAASPAAIVVSQALAVVSPAPAVPSIGAPMTQPAQISNASEDSWNEIVEIGNSEEFFFMISESNALQDIACEYDGSDDDEFNVQIADKHILRCCLERIFNEWAALVDKSADSFALPSSDGQGETLEQLNSPCPWMLASASDDDEVESDGGGKVVCSPTWASLDNHNLAAKSMSMKSKFNGDALHDDRIRIHH